jgi:D-lactate dehydrogenase
MQVAVFNTKAYDHVSLPAANAAHGHALTFFEPRLTLETCTLAQGFPAICPSSMIS